MVVYPTEPKPSYAYIHELEYKTIVTEFETGKEFATQQWRFPKRRVSLQYNALKPNELETLWNFYVSRRGSHLPFWFFDEYSKDDNGNPLSYTDLYVGRGDGSTTIFDLPGKNTSNQLIYVDGISTSVTILAGKGSGGADRCQFASAPANGALITADFKGIVRIRMRFATDKLSREMFVHLLYKTGIDLIERKFS